MNGIKDERPRHLVLASVSLALGVIGLWSLVVWQSGWSLLVLLAAVVCGHVARFRIRRSEGRWTGMMSALLGCLLGYGTVPICLFVPATGDASLQGRPTTMMNNGRNLYVLLIAYDLENPWSPISVWPQEDERDGRVFSTSTEFLRWVVTGGVMNVDFSFFAGPNIPPIKSTNAVAFQAKNNGWCVVSGVTSNTPDGMPVLFTTDLGVTNLSQLTGPIGDTVIKRGPLRGKALVIIENGGGAYTMRPSQFGDRWEDVLTNYDAWYGDHPVLRP